MCGGGKGVQQTSQQTSMPSWPAALAYNQAMSKVAEATSTPFQKYSSDPTAYVASLTPTQTGAIQNVTGLQGMTTPYYQAATGLTAAGAAPVSQLTSADIQQYMNPFMSQVVDPITAALQQQQGRQLAQQQAEAIKGGAFGGQQAGLQRQALRGQQQLGLGQALSPLFQTGYGQALQTAQGQQGIQAQNLQRMLAAGQQFGGLGTAAQQAALQQASAQLQAGTLQQQTETAQKQALYNEFQKQRMYPLQVAQMYAQTAGALGPLMGSTGMGYQQMPFFGGFAADGGAIEGYDDGLGAARMGGAVDEPGDYARGGYAYGGDTDFGSIVAQHKAAITPQMEEISFPTGSFQTGRAPELGTLPERREGILGGLAKAAIKDPSAAYEKAKGLYEGVGKAKDFLSSFASGGDVEDDAMSDLLSHPVQASRPQQMQAPAGKQGSGLLGGLMKTGASLAANYFLPGSGPVVSGGLSALGMAGGGRAAFQEGGYSDEDLSYYLRPLAKIESGGEKNPYAAIGPATKSGDRAYGKYQIMGANVPSWTKEALGRAMTPQEFLADQKAQEETAKHRFGQYLSQTGAPEEAAAMWFGGPGYKKHANARDVLGTSIPQYQAMYKKGLGEAGLEDLGPRDRSMMALYPEAGQAPSGVVPGEAGIGSGQVSDKGFLERVGEKPERLIVPVLQGLGAMAASKNRYALGALAEGLGAGAGSYMDMQQKEADILKRRQEAKTEAEETRKRAAGVGLEEAATGLTGAQTLKEVLESGRLGVQQFGPADAPFYIVTLEDGTKMPLDQWMEKGGNLIGGTVAADLARRLAGGRGTPATTAVETAKEVSKGPTVDATQPGQQPPLTQPVQPPTLTPGVIYDDESRKLAQEDKKIKLSQDPSLVRTAEEARKIYAPQTMLDAQTARNNTPFLNELSASLAKANKGKGFATPGFAAATRSQLIKAADTLYRALGGEGSLSNLPEVTDVTGKLTQFLGREAAANAGQDSFAALKAIKEALPNIEMDPRAGAKLAAELLVLRKRSIDREEHMKAWSRDSGGVLYNAQKNFSEKNPDAKYQIAQQVIADMIINHPDAYEKIMSGTMSRDSIEKQIRAPKEKRGYGSGVPVGISEFFPSTETTRRKTP